MDQFPDRATELGPDPTSTPSQFLSCCNQRGDNIAVFQVNRKTGALRFTGHHTPVGNASVIVFLDLAKVG